MSETPVFRWSPEPQVYYARGVCANPWVADLDPHAWNLAWLTVPNIKTRAAPPGTEALLVAALNSRLEFNGDSGRVSHYTGMSAPAFVTVMKAASWPRAEPALMRNNPNWRKDWAQKAQQARSDHPYYLNLTMDSEVKSVAAAKIVLDRIAEQVRQQGS